MSMKILENSKQIRCSSCDCLYEFDNKDVNYEYRTEWGFLFNTTYKDYFVKCPVCEKKYYLREEFYYKT